MDCLNERQTDRNFDTKQLSLQDLSDLVWAANGINRPESGKRTVPTATNWQEMVLYVATADGIYRYNAEKHELELVKNVVHNLSWVSLPCVLSTRPIITKKGESRILNTKKNTLTTTPATWHNPFIWYAPRKTWQPWSSVPWIRKN